LEQPTARIFRVVKQLEAADSSEMLVPIYQTVWHHIPEDNNLDVHCHENLISHATLDVLNIIFPFLINFLYILATANPDYHILNITNHVFSHYGFFLRILFT
jgi:hypothetical protein